MFVQSFRIGILGRSVFSFVERSMVSNTWVNSSSNEPSYTSSVHGHRCWVGKSCFLPCPFQTFSPCGFSGLYFSRVSSFERTPFPLKHYRELTRPSHFALSLLMEYLVAHSSCSMVMIGHIVADEVPKPKEREHGA